MDGAETLGIRSFIINNSRAIRRRLFPDLGDYEHIGYDGGSKDKINRKRLIGNTYQIYRSILHQLAIDENWNNVYSGITLPCHINRIPDPGIRIVSVMCVTLLHNILC